VWFCLLLKLRIWPYQSCEGSLWLKGFVEELRMHDQIVIVHCDDSYQRTKFVMTGTKLHFVREEIAKEFVKVNNISTNYSPFDTITEMLPNFKFYH